MRDSLLENAQSKNESEVEEILSKYDSYELSKEFHDDYTGLDFTIYNAVNSEGEWLITLTHLEDGSVDVKEVLNIPYDDDYEEELQQAQLKSSESVTTEPIEDESTPTITHDWDGDKVDVPDMHLARVKDYTTRGLINDYIHYLVDKEGFSDVRIDEYCRNDEDGVWAASICFDDTFYVIIREDDNSNVYCTWMN